MNLRDGFQDIVSGWLLIDDFDDLTDRIERSATWARANQPLTDDEMATVRLMIDRQIALGGDVLEITLGGDLVAVLLRDA